MAASQAVADAILSYFQGYHQNYLTVLETAAVSVSMRTIGSALTTIAQLGPIAGIRIGTRVVVFHRHGR